MTKITGSCLCGQLHYHGDVEIMGAANCHCDDCRKASGAAYLTNVFVKEDGLTIEGQQMQYMHKSDRGSDMTKINCAECGSPVFGRNSAREGVVVLRAGSLDQKELIEPGMTVYASQKIPSTPVNENLKIFDKMPS